MRSRTFRSLGLGLLALCLQGLALAQTPAPTVDLAVQKWHGQAICYSGYREGQHPDKQVFPTPAQVLEDMRILEPQWRLIRLYGSDQHSQDVLETLKRHKLKIKVMLGVWLSGKPGKEAENQRQVAKAIQLANAFPSIVVAVNVGNEALVSWSDHKMTEEALLACVLQVKAAVKCRVTVADDFLYWLQPGSKIAEHLDFITLHSYPIWGHLDIDQGLSATTDKFEQIRKLYPGKTIVFGEVGWASFTETNPQHVPRAGDEVKQQRYYGEINAWAKARGVTSFYFEAFDEPWKGAGTEGHWGVFTVQRKAKPVMQGLYPHLKPSGPTSPSYETQGPSPKVDGK